MEKIAFFNPYNEDGSLDYSKLPENYTKEPWGLQEAQAWKGPELIPEYGPLGPPISPSHTHLSYAHGFSGPAAQHKFMDEEFHPKLKAWADYCRSLPALSAFAYETPCHFFVCVGKVWYSKEYFNADQAKTGGSYFAA